VLFLFCFLNLCLTKFRSFLLHLKGEWSITHTLDTTIWGLMRVYVSYLHIFPPFTSCTQREILYVLTGNLASLYGIRCWIALLPDSAYIFYRHSSSPFQVLYIICHFAYLSRHRWKKWNLDLKYVGSGSSCYVQNVPCGRIGFGRRLL
jgi:hypothetical protein